MNDVLIKAKFFSLKKIVISLSVSLVIIIAVVASINYYIYTWRRDVFYNKASQSLLPLCLEMETYYCDTYEALENGGAFSSSDVLEDYTEHSLFTKFSNATIEVDKQTYSIPNAGELWFNEHIPYKTSEFWQEAPDSLYKPVMKQFKSNYLKNGIGFILLLFSLCIVLAITALYAFIIIGFVFLGYNHLIVTKRNIYAKSMLGKKTEIPIDSILEVSKISGKGLAISSLSETKKILFIQNRDSIYSSLSSMLQKKQRIE